MLGRAHRFHGYNSVLPVYRSAKQARVEGFSLHYKPNPRRKSYRLAVVVSKKVAKSAVTRNRMRRRVYEVVRQSITIEKPHDLIITIYDDNVADMDAAALQKTITNLFAKSGLSSR